MKSKSTGLVAIILMAAVVLMVNQKTSAENVQSAGERMGGSKSDSQATYSHECQKFKRTSEQRIQNNVNRIAAFKERSEQSGTKMKARYSKEMTRLEKENRGMKNRLEEYRDDGKTAWADFKTAFNTDMDKITKAVEHLTSDSQATYSDEWQQFKSTSERRIRANENGIAAFKEKLDKSGAKMKTKYNKEIVNLEKETRLMRKKLEDYKNDGSGAWSDFKRGFNNELDKLGKAVRDLTSDNG